MNYTDYYRYLINEAFVNKDEFNDALSKSTVKYVTVEMDTSGKVYFSPDFDNQVPYSKRKGWVILNFTKNFVEVRGHESLGNRMDTGLQQLLQQLKKDNIIDSSWKVSFKDDVGLYKQGKYSYIHGTYDKLPISSWDRKSRISTDGKFVLYHGTSSEDLPTILKHGLQPLGRKYTSPGSAARLRTEKNKDFLYLATNFNTAYRYATDRASDQMRRLHKEKWQYVQHSEVAYWDIKPVVIEVIVPDLTKLKSDDDRVIQLIKNKGQELWDRMPEDQKEKEWEQSKIWFKQNAGFVPSESDKSSYYWTISNNGLQYVLDRFDHSEWDNWKASIKSDQQVAYQGFIPPNYIQVKEL